MANDKKLVEVPAPYDVALKRCPKCGAPARIVMFEYPMPHFIRELYGAKCESCKYIIPLAFSTAKSAAYFWNENAETFRKKSASI